MKKLSLALLLSLISSFSLHANDLKRGYRGFVDLSTEFYQKTDYMNSNIKHIATRYDLSTSHGYQFNPHFFCGAGFSIHTERFNDRDYIINFPLFIEGRTDWTFGKVPLFFDLRLGCNIFGQVDTDYTPLFIIPAIGYRLDWGRRTCANFSLGVSLHGNKEYDEFSFHFLALPSIRVGIEF